MRKALLVKLSKNGLSPTWPDLAHWSMLMTMTMTMQIVVRLVEADVLLVAWWKMEESAMLLAQTITENDCATRVEAFPIWSIDKFLYPLKWVQGLDYISELGSCLGSLNGRSRRSTTSISMGEPPGWDWRGSKMAVLKYLICRYPLPSIQKDHKRPQKTEKDQK